MRFRRPGSVLSGRLSSGGRNCPRLRPIVAPPCPATSAPELFVRFIPLLAAVTLLLGGTSLRAERWWNRKVSAPPRPATGANLDFSVVKSAAASQSPGEGIPEPDAATNGVPTVYYFDGKMHWCMLPDDTILVWTGSKWVPPGVIYWGGSRAEDAKARAASPPGTWIHSRFNVESRDYRSRYGTDAWFQYGPGHYLD